MNPTILTILAGLALPTTVGAEPDNRPSDRFFFGLGVGATGGPTAQFGTAMPGGPALAYETSYWPSDYLGLGLDVHISRMGEAQTTITSVDLGVPILVGVPLRWVQPYAGVRLGLDRTYFDGPSTGNDTVGFRRAAHPVAGINAYVSRNLRLFVQWESRPLRDCPPSASSCQESAFGQELLVGARGSPDWFHRKRGRMKFQTVYWSALGTVLLWGLAIWGQ